MKASETKKSRLETRPSSSGGTRRCSSVPQMTVAAWYEKPTMNSATTMTHSWSVNPMTTSGSEPAPQNRFITVR